MFKKIKPFLSLLLVLTLFLCSSTTSFAAKPFVEEEYIKTMYVTTALNARSIPDKSGKYLGTLQAGTEVNIVSKITSNKYNNYVYYKTDDNKFLHGNYLSLQKPVNVQISVNNILQNPELPNGCEVTSLAIVLNHFGYTVDKCDLADNYLPKSETLLEDPNEYYLRDPRTNGFYCFAGPLIKCVENYNKENNLDIVTKDLTNSDVSALYEELDNDYPIIIWGTLRWKTPHKYKNGLYSNLHCMVLAGYTDTTVTIIDPIYGDKYKTISRSTFESIWTQMGQRALKVY